MQDGQQQVLFVYLVHSLYTCLKYRELQYVAGLLVEQQVARTDGRTNLVFLHALFEHAFDGLHIDLHLAKYVDDWAFLHAEKSQQ